MNEKYNITLDNNPATFLLQIQQGNDFIVNVNVNDDKSRKFIEELKKLIENYYE